jgi:ribose-phosphate pyrophosphokinase
MTQLNRHTKIFSGNSNKILAIDIAKNLGMELGNIEVDRFSDGEINVEIKDHVRGHDIFIIQSTCSPANDNLMELLVMIDAFKRSAVSSIICVIPYYGYSRQDRRPDFMRTPISSKLVASLLETAGMTQMITVDLHSGQQQGFFSVPVINTSALTAIKNDIWCYNSFDIHEGNIVVVSPDAGGVFRARKVAQKTNDADLAVIDKRRERANQSEVMHVIGDVKDKKCIIVDDMIDTAGTLCKGAKALKEHGALSVSAYATHGVLSGKALDNIDNSELDEVIVTNTIPIEVELDYIENSRNKIRQLDISTLISETMRRIELKESISEMYNE